MILILKYDWIIQTSCDSIFGYKRAVKIHNPFTSTADLLRATTQLSLHKNLPSRQDWWMSQTLPFTCSLLATPFGSSKWLNKLRQIRPLPYFLRYFEEYRLGFKKKIWTFENLNLLSTVGPLPFTKWWIKTSSCFHKKIFKIFDTCCKDIKVCFRHSIISFSIKLIMVFDTLICLENDK